MAAGASANAFEYVDKADEIAGNIFVGAGNGASYSGLRRQMNDGIEIAVAEEAFPTGAVGQVKREKPESGTDAKLAQPRILEPRVVVVVKVVYANNLEPICKKAVDEVGADETGGAGHQDSFVSCLLRHISLSFTASVTHLPHFARLTELHARFAWGVDSAL